MFTVPARGRAQLIASDIHLALGGRPVLTGVDLTVTPGSRWGVVGENGRGKTTLLQTLAGRLTADAGEVRLLGTLGTAAQETTAEDRTVGDVIDAHLADARAALVALDTIALRPTFDEGAYQQALDAAEALDAWDADRRVDVALEALGAITDRNRSLTTMSVGQRYRVRLACLLGAADDFLLLDEPTNHLDRAGLDFLTRRLREWPGGVVLVSHDRALLTDVATDILDLDPGPTGRPTTYGNGYPGYVEGRAAQWQRWSDEYADQQAEHARLTENLAAAQSRLITGWRPDKGTGKHQRATRAPALVRSVHRRREDLERHALTVPEPPRRFTMPDLPEADGTLVWADNVTVAGRLHTPVTLTLTGSTRLVITGPNGTGKSTLLSVLAGHFPPTTGEASRKPDARTALLAQESPGRGQTARQLLGDDSFGLIAAQDLDRPVRELSTGQQRRVDLAVVLSQRPHLLLLDEPTNHLSIALVDDLTEALQATPAAVVLATHDRRLSRDVAHWPHLKLTP